MWLRFARKTTTAAATSGTVVLEGRVVEADKTLAIPGSTSRPIFYDLSFESYRAIAGGRGRAAWTVDRADVQIVPFLLEDEAGKIWVKAERDHVIVSGGRPERGTTGRSAAGRYSGRLILPGDVVKVRGEVYELKRGAVSRGLRASKERPLEILFRQPGGQVG